MNLNDLVEQKFQQLHHLLRAAESGKFIEGRDNVGIYALPDLPQRASILEAYQMHGFGEVFQAAVEAEQEREARLGKSVLIRGPLIMDTVIEIWLATKYFLENANDFQRIERRPEADLSNLKGIDRWDYRVEAKIPRAAHTEQQKVLLVQGDDYHVGIAGPLLNRKFFRLSVMQDPKLILPGCLEHEYDFSFSTFEIVDGQHNAPLDRFFDVHLNGPERHPIMRDLLVLGNALIEYCLERCDHQY